MYSCIRSGKKSQRDCPKGKVILTFLFGGSALLLCVLFRFLLTDAGCGFDGISLEVLAMLDPIFCDERGR